MMPTDFVRNSLGVFVSLMIAAAATGCKGNPESTPESTEETGYDLTPIEDVQGEDPQSPPPVVSVSPKPAPVPVPLPGDATKNVKITDVIASIKAVDVKRDMQQLVGEIPAEISTGNVYIKERKTTTGRSNTRKWIREHMVAAGLKTSDHVFSSGGYGTNIEGVLEGKSGRHLYVTAHFDSVTSYAANDNASGTVAILAAARALSKYRPRDSVHFVGFDLEEIGLVGSSAYVRDRVLPLYQKDRSQVLGNLNFDMVGYNAGKSRFAVADCGTAPHLVEDAMDGIDEANISLNPGTGCAGRSDHVSFTKYGMPGVMFMDDTYYLGYPWYHKTTDTLEKVDTAYLTRVGQALAAAIVKIAFP